MKKTIAALLAPALLFAAGAAEAKSLIGVDIASDDHVYYWYSDNGGEVSSGSTDDHDRFRALADFGLRTDGWSLMAVGINSADRVYYWWLNGNLIQVTVGTTTDPDAYGVDNGFQEISGDYILLDAGIANDDRVYYYWRHRTTGATYNSVGSSTLPTLHRGITPVEGAIFMQNNSLRDVGIASDDHIYFYWQQSGGNYVVTSGTSLNPFAYRDAYPANQP